MIAQEESLTIMQQLKASTQAQHDATENGAFNEELVKGRLPLNLYVDSLGQLFLIHRTLERRLREFRAEMPAFARVLRDYQFQEPYLRNDLEFFGRNPDEIQPLNATRAFVAYIERLADTTPMALMGVHYVFEGSNNGSKFISRAVKKAYNLSDGKGTHYLDPYGDQQKNYWQAFKDDMNAVGFLPPETDAIVAAAGATFEAVMHLHRELYEGAESKCTAHPTIETASAQAAAKPTGKCPFHRG